MGIIMPAGVNASLDDVDTLILVDQVVEVLSRNGFKALDIKYPEDPNYRGIDVFAVRETDDKKLFIKVIKNYDRIYLNEIKDMRRLGRILDVKPLVITKRFGKESLEDIVVYEKNGVHVVSVEGLEHVINKEAYVVFKQGTYYVKIDGEKLKEHRERRGLSLGDVAVMTGVSRRSIYLYEKNYMDASLNVALKLVEIFGEDILKPVDIFSEKTLQRDSDNIEYDTREEAFIVSKLIEAGSEVVHTTSTPIDIVAKRESTSIVFLVDHKKRGKESGGKRGNVIDKAVEAAKIIDNCGSIDYRYVFASGSGSLIKELEDMGFQVVKKLEELKEEILRLISHHTNRGYVNKRDLSKDI